MQYLPCWVIDVYRAWESIGGTESKSVLRFVHPNSRPTIKSKQLEWNTKTPSHVIKGLLGGMRLAMLEDYNGIKQPTALIVGDQDLVTPSQITVSIYKSRTRAGGKTHGPYVIPEAAHSVFAEKNELVNALITSFIQKKCKLEVGVPVHTASSKLKNFNNKPKWALKNYSKWKATLPIGAVIGAREGNGGICGCKVLRQDDAHHSPYTFGQANSNIGIIIDVSRETPPYITSLPSCQYVKLATASKIVPSRENVDDFISVVREFQQDEANKGKHVAVHCHYGFNRTGFLISSYLIESLGYTVDAAVDAVRVSCSIYYGSCAGARVCVAELLFAGKPHVRCC